VPRIVEQDNVAQALARLFERTTIIDRRQQPSHGYRAVHVIVHHDGRPIEIQIRTTLQHLWAEFSEKLSDIVDPAIKYGGGDEKRRESLIEFSSLVENYESSEARVPELQTWLQSALQENSTDEEKQQLGKIREKMAALQENLELTRQDLFQFLRKQMESVSTLKGKKNAISD
jgi:ppGpp synthetase/RelA/SpoT-type nucleotidyltranferase